MNCLDGNAVVKNDKAPDEQQPLSAIQMGEPAAFAELYAAYSPRLYRTIVRITKNHQDAEDALQETFLRAHLKLDTFEGRSSIFSWLTRIAINSALMILRQRRIRPETLYDPQPDAWTDALSFEIRDLGPDPEQACDLRERKAKVLHAIRRLESQLQAPLRMQALGSSLKEISHALNISEAAVKARLHRARRRLSTRRVFQTFSSLASESRLQRDCGAKHYPAF